MSQRIIKIFLGSPSDVNEERKAVEKVIEELNKSDQKVKLELTSSDTAYPGHGQENQGGQHVINKQIGNMKEYDLFVGIMGERIGSKTKDGYVSGTVEEYERAYESLRDKGQPNIWFYFRDVGNKEIEKELSEFKKKIEARAFYKKYSDVEDFKKQFENHMKSWKEKPENNTLLEITEQQKADLIESIAQEIAEIKMNLLGKELLFINHKKLKGDKQNDFKRLIQKMEEKLLEKFKNLHDYSSIKGDNSKLKSKIAEHLCSYLFDIEKKQLLEKKKDKEKQNKYGAGNILNLLIQLDLKKDFSYFNLSGIYIYEADLEKAILKGVDFSNADMKNSSFSEPLGCIHSIAFNADGTYFATGDAHGIIRVYNTESLETRIFNSERRNQIWSVAFGSNKENEKKSLQMLAWGAEDGNVKVLSINNIVDDSSSNNVTQNTIIYESNEGRRILSVAFSPDGNIFAIGGDGDKAIKLVEINNNNSQKGVLDATDVSCMTFTDDNFIACGSQDGKISLFDVGNKTQERNQSKKAHKEVVRCIAFNKNQNIIASGGEDGKVKMFRLPNLEEMDLDVQEQISQVRTLAFSGDGNILAIGYIDNTSSKEQSEHKILLLKFEDGKWSSWKKLDNSKKEGHEHLIRSIAFCPDSKNAELLISGGDGRTVKLWDIKTEECKHTLSGYANRIWSVAFSRDGKTFACGGEDNKIRIWNSCERTHIPTQILSKHTDWVWSVAFSAKGNILASSSEDNKIFLWQLETQQSEERQSEEQKWEYIRELTGHNKRVRCVVFNPNGDKLASAGNDNKVLVWDITEVNSTVLPEEFSPHKDRILSLAFSPNGRYLASSSRDKTISLVDIQESNVYPNLGDDQHRHKDQVHSIAFSSNGDELVSGGFDKKVKLWKVTSEENNSKPSLKHIITLLESQKILSVAYYSDTKKTIIASAGDGHFITLWNIKNIEKPIKMKTLKGHKRTVESIAFSPDGKKLISCSQDQTIKFWQIEGDINVSIHTIELGKPYQGMNIFGVNNLEDPQISALEELGASRNV